MKLPDYTGWAKFSEEGDPPRCRFALGRDFINVADNGLLLSCGLNPSRAGAKVNDMTVVKGMGFARVLGYAGTIHVNAFPFITPYPSLLGHCTEEEISLNDNWLVEMATKAKIVALTWGSFPQFKERFWKVARLLAPFNPVCFGRTTDGYPKHISRIGYATPIEPWKVPVAV